MDRYRKTADTTRAIDAMADAMRKRQRKLGKLKRKDLVQRAVTIPLTDKQRGREA
jgi:hypothetical protein